MIKKIYLKLFPHDYNESLQKVLSHVDSVVDIGCGECSPIRIVKKTFYAVGIDAFEPVIEKSKKRKIHDKYYQMGALDIKQFKTGEFDVAVASDLIEHLPKEDGKKLLQEMERIAKKRVVIFTPNGFLEQGACYNNPFQRHLSGWTAKEMQKRGYKVIGIGGLKYLRKEHAELKFRPQFLWRFISDMTQKFTKSHPHYAHQIFCVKEIN